MSKAAIELWFVWLMGPGGRASAEKRAYKIKVRLRRVVGNVGVRTEDSLGVEADSNQDSDIVLVNSWFGG